MSALLEMTRRKYKEIKKYDRKQMDDFISNIYADGVSAGMKDGFNKGLNTALSVVETGVKNCEGIGPKKSEAIMNSVHNELKKLAERSNASYAKESEKKEE